MLDALLEAAADSSSFPLRARTRHLFEWPVHGRRFKHGQHDVEMTLDSLFRLVRHSLQSAGQREDDAGADELQRRLQHLELLPCIVMHATRGERGGQLVLEAEPTKLLTERRGKHWAFRQPERTTEEEEEDWLELE